MINKDELLFVVDEENKPREAMPRHLVHKKNLLHRTTGIWVINNNKQILCQKRSLKKDTKPGFWEAFFGGHLGPTEAYLANAAQELHEELGIAVVKENLIPFAVRKSDKATHKEFQHIFAYRIDTTRTNFAFEKEEIDQLQWFSLQELTHILLETHDPKWVRKPWDKEVLAWLAKEVC